MTEMEMRAEALASRKERRAEIQLRIRWRLQEIGDAAADGIGVVRSEAPGEFDEARLGNALDNLAFSFARLAALRDVLEALND